MGILSEGPAGLRILGFDKAEKGGCMTAFLFCAERRREGRFRKCLLVRIVYLYYDRRVQDSQESVSQGADKPQPDMKCI